MNRRLMIAAAFASLALTGCMRDDGMPGPGGPGFGPGTVTGSATYRERGALPRGAVLVVRVIDVARQDTAARVLGIARIPAFGRQVPIPFTVRYRGDNRGRYADYAIRAEIRANRELLFTTDTRYPLPPDGRIDLMLDRARR